MSKSNSTLLIVLIVIFTFPLWIAVAGGIFGLIGGLFGALFSIIGALIGAIGSVIGAIFGGFGCFLDDFPFGGNRFFTALIIVLIIVLATRPSRSPKR